MTCKHLNSIMHAREAATTSAAMHDIVRWQMWSMKQASSRS